MSITAEDHKQAAHSMQAYYCAALSQKFPLNIALKAVAHLHGTSWETLQARPGLPPVPRGERVSRLKQFLDAQGVVCEDVDFGELEVLCGLAARAVPEGPTGTLYLLLDTDYVTQAYRGVCLTGHYIDDLGAEVLKDILRPHYRHIKIVDVHDAIQDEFRRMFPDEEVLGMDCEALCLQHLLLRDPGILERLAQQQEAQP